MGLDSIKFIGILNFKKMHILKCINASFVEKGNKNISKKQRSRGFVPLWLLFTLCNCNSSNLWVWENNSNFELILLIITISDKGGNGVHF